MMTGFSHANKLYFQHSSNVLWQIIMLNVLSFGGLLLLKTLLIVAGYGSAYTAICHTLALPGSWVAYLHQPWSLLTHYWVHTSFFATLWGLLLLHTLGKIVINLIGSQHFIVLYLLGGLVGGLFFLLTYRISPHFQRTSNYLLGFSGSLYAVMVAAAALAPRLSLSFLLLGPVKLKYIAIFFVLLSLVNLSSTDPVSSIACLGGALLGYVYAKQLYGYHWLQWWRSRFQKRSLKVIYRKPSAVERDQSKASIDQSRLDEILDKVAVSGYSSLTRAEKQQLFEAGQ